MKNQRPQGEAFETIAEPIIRNGNHMEGREPLDRDVPENGDRRAIIETVTPQIDGGRHPVKRIVGDRIIVEVDIFADGHELLSAVLKHRRDADGPWLESPMEPLKNDRWRGEFRVTEAGCHSYTVEAWVDGFKSWRLDLQKKVKAGLNVSTELKAGAELIRTAAQRADALESDRLLAWAAELVSGDCASGGPVAERALDAQLAGLMYRHPDRSHSSVCDRDFPLIVDPPLARYSAWYEMFPRSCELEPGRHGTFKDCETQLPRIAGMGFDVLYFPPIHPIGRSFRKGKNNAPAARPGDPGSPWGIGATEGGHKSVHPRLGTLDDFRRLVRHARECGLEIALDIALHCSPDHPYVTAHPGWFRNRPDGSIQYAENPPKKYQDIYPFDFECEDWRGLWLELKSIFEFWIEQGVRIFRVDNPHTKAFPFWEWCLAELKRQCPELIFLAEAFTRPVVLRHLAKLGFTQSYNYFPWRNTKEELVSYFTELTRGPAAEFLRPILWPNTPDILTEYLQSGGRPAFIVRLVLAATLGASYGIYGPAYELCENNPREPDSEEYLNSEKYEIRHWNLNAPGGLQELITRVNRIRRENPALQTDHRLEFHPVNNDQLIAYTKSTADGTDTVLTVVNLDPQRKQSGWVELPMEHFRLDPGRVYQMHDLLTGARYLWRDMRNYVELDPHFAPAHIFRLRQRVRTEQDFDYYT
jgi:starch synthase (maltosyl-transferring)